jgi:hypothetical protein
MTSIPKPDVLDVQDYLDATSDAAKRKRSAGITVVIASLVVFAGLLNSLQHSWMRERLLLCNGVTSPYVIDKIGAPPAAHAAWQLRYQQFYASLMQTNVVPRL